MLCQAGDTSVPSRWQNGFLSLAQGCLSVGTRIPRYGQRHALLLTSSFASPVERASLRQAVSRHLLSFVSYRFVLLSFQFRLNIVLKNQHRSASILPSHYQPVIAGMTRNPILSFASDRMRCRGKPGKTRRCRHPSCHHRTHEPCVPTPTPNGDVARNVSTRRLTPTHRRGGRYWCCR